MATIAAMRREIRKLRQMVGTPDDPVEWRFILEAGESIPRVWRSQINERDSVLIREIPSGWIDLSGAACGHYREFSGDVWNIWPDGTKDKVKNEQSYGSRTRRRASAYR